VIYLEDIKNKFKGSGGWFRNFIKWINEGKEINPLENSKYKYLLGSKNWLKKISKKISINAVRKIEEKNKYYELKVDFKKLLKEKLEIQIYILSKYTALTNKEISKKLNIKTGAAVSQRLYRYRKNLERDEEESELLKLIEQKKGTGIQQLTLDEI